MTIRRLFPQTKPPTSIPEARARARILYREWLREIPRAIQKFPLEITVAEGRARVRAEFERYAVLIAALGEPDALQASHVSILKGTQDLIEVHNRWAQKGHFMRWFDGSYERENPVTLDHSRQQFIALRNQQTNNIVLPDTPFIRQFLAQNTHK